MVAAAGPGGLLLYSSDYGENWTYGASGTTEDLNEVFTNNYGDWVACGADGTVVYNNAAYGTWSVVDLGSDNLNALAFGAEIWGQAEAWPHL